LMPKLEVGLGAASPYVDLGMGRGGSRCRRFTFPRKSNLLKILLSAYGERMTAVAIDLLEIDKEAN
jgi:hypothetical protein